MAETAPRRSPLARMPDGALLAAVGVLALACAGILLWAVRDWALAAGFGAAVVAIGGLGWIARRFWPDTPGQMVEPDWSMVRAAADNDGLAIAITDRTGRLVCANMLHENWFGGPMAPPVLGFSDGDTAQLTAAGKAAWRDGRARASGLMRGLQGYEADVVRSGRNEDHLLWRFRPAVNADLVQDVRDLVSGQTGHGMGQAGIMLVMLDEGGRLLECNAAFALRATGRIDGDCAGREFVSFLERDQHGQVRFVHGDARQPPLRLMQVQLDPDTVSAPLIIVLLDEPEGTSGNAPLVSQIQSLLGELPLGLALADRDGRFIFLNDAFCRAVRLPSGSRPIYPGDLVVREDKGPVADAVRRFANGQAVSSDIAIRLRDQPEEPVALTIAGLRGMGDAALLLSLKDNTEESRLKRQIAQASKMQAIGQLAGGVAHDFNNILTGILGHCDLMLMRHTPGESDYDDIQQIRSNANRAAALTRQLLAFSRQQTLRPQILQLPDVVSEISNLLKRLLGETVLLDVKHGRGLGAVRADPGQLEQVIVNLAVNARDAMPKGGTVTIQTFAVTKADVRDMGSDIMPVADYSAFSVSDTGTGIPPELLTKIFEPFFTTKDVGKGTGLGLSTVYGIVKQSGGFIFADSKPGQGTRFVIYLPVHGEGAEAVAAAPKPVEAAQESWGSGTILLVEDEDMVRAVAERALTRNGYTVVTAANGEEGLEILEERQDFDMIVSDVVMPVMDGPAMVKEARKALPEIPVLFMSGYAEEQLRKSIDVANVAFLPKPFSVQQLSQAVRDTLAKG